MYEGSYSAGWKGRQNTALPADMSASELNHLFASCMPRLQRAARRLLRNSEDSEDALQEGLLLAYQNLKQFQGRAKFSTWLHSIVTNSARTHVRKMKCRPQCSLDDFLDLGERAIERVTMDSTPGPHERCARLERVRLLLQVMEELPSKHYGIMKLCDIDGMDGKDAAQRLGIPAGTVKATLFRARRFVTRRLRERYIPGYQQFSEARHPVIPRVRLVEFREQTRSASGSTGTTEQPDVRSCARKWHVRGGHHESGNETTRNWKHSAPHFADDTGSRSRTTYPGC
jgi:RNA polymerase sigma-70 factor (ECF subfamily)